MRTSYRLPSLRDAHIRAVFTIASLLTAAAGPTLAQQPALQWQPMREAAFNAPRARPTASPQEHAVLQRLWAKELAGAREMELGVPYPSAALLGTAQAAGQHFVFTIYARAGYEPCQPAQNGASVEYSHWVCPLRVARLQDAQDQALTVLELPGYCMLWGDNTDAPRAQNRVEFAYEAKAATLHLRTVEHGKVVPQCSRSVRLAG